MIIGVIMVVLGALPVYLAKQLAKIIFKKEESEKHIFYFKMGGLVLASIGAIIVVISGINK